MEEHDSLDDDLENIQQPERFDLELELVRWVKIAASKTIPPVMCKPAGPITQHYGLDSKSRWREAVCVMMLEADPHLETEGTNKLGRQLAQLFRQDLQLWEVKARQLHNWVKRGLTNVKLLDRTLAYFQNQSSWLQYIKNLKNPIPMIETPGFPGTQWSEHYWKEQTVMLLMQESGFPQGTDPVFCSRLFREEPGKWKLKMEQFKSWLERGKTDPLPEYFGTGKNCPECGLFLWDTRSFLKHMKRNHGVKINDREKSNSGRESPDGAASPPLLFISDKRSKSPIREENTDESSAAETADEKNSANGAESADPDDKFPATSDSEPSTSQATSSRHSTPNRLPSTPNRLPSIPGTAARGSSLPSKGATKASSTPSGSSRAVAPTGRGSSKAAAKQDKQVEGDVGTDENSGSGEDSGPSLLSLTLPSRSAATKREERLSGGNPTVFCPECNFKTTHSKIVDHLLKCKKALAANKPDKPPVTSRSGRILQSPGANAAATASEIRPTAGGSGGQSGRSGVSPVRAISPKLAPAESSSAVPSSSRAKETVSASSTSSSSKPKSSPFQKTNNIVKKVFWKKFESERQQQNNRNNNSRDSPEPYKSPDSSSYRSPEQARSPDQYKPPLKLKLSRKEGSTDSSYFEINKPIISSLLRQNMNRFSPTASRVGGGGHSPISDRSPSHPRSPVPSSSPSYRSPVRSPTPTGQGNAETRSPAHYTAISSTVTSPRTQPLPTTPSPVDLSMKPHDDTKLPPPVRVIIKKYEFSKEDKDKSTAAAAAVKHETDNAPIKDESQSADNKDADVDMKEEGGDDPKKSGGLRGGRGRAVFSCPLCTTEFAILSNLEKHIDKDHKDIEKPTRKRRSVTMKKSSPDFSSVSSSPPKRSRKFTGEGSKPDDSTVSDTNSSIDTSMDTSTDADNRKLTEYEIFQSLQLKTKNERRKMTCTECGLQIPPNNMKRHMERHNKEGEGDETSQTQDLKKKNSGMEGCKECGKEMKKNMIKRHMAKHKREDAAVDPPAAVGSSTSAGSPAGTDDRIPCKECGKRLPKNAMKRHLMKHEADNFMPSTGKTSVNAEDNVKVEPEGYKGTASAQSHDEEEKDIYSKSLSLQRSASPSQKQTEVKSKAERKKITCDTCGLTCAPNTYKRHMDRHKREDENPGEAFAPIEITPTKDYWEMNDVKPNLEKVKTNLTSSSSNSAAPAIPTPVVPPAAKQGRSSNRRTSTTEQRSESPAVPPAPPVKPTKTTSSLREVRKKDLLARKDAENNAKKDFSLENVKVKLEDESESKPEIINKETSINNSTKPTDKQQDSSLKKSSKRSTSSPSNSEDSLAAKSDENVSTDSNNTDNPEKKVNKYIKEVQEQEKGKVSGSDEEGEGPLEQAVRKVVSYKMTPKQALQIYNLTPKVLFDYLLGETDEDRMAILKKVNLKSADEDRVIQFCTENEDHLSYKSVISFVKDLKHKDGDEDFTLSRLEAYRWWYAFRKKFDLKITAKKK